MDIRSADIGYSLFKGISQNFFVSWLKTVTWSCHGMWNEVILSKGGTKTSESVRCGSVKMPGGQRILERFPESEKIFFPHLFYLWWPSHQRGDLPDNCKLATTYCANGNTIISGVLSLSMRHAHQLVWKNSTFSWERKAKVTLWLDKQNFTTLTNIPYRPNFSSCNLCLLWILQYRLAGWKFSWI